MILTSPAAVKRVNGSPNGDNASTVATAGFTLMIAAEIRAPIRSTTPEVQETKSRRIEQACDDEGECRPDGDPLGWQTANDEQGPKTTTLTTN